MKQIQPTPNEHQWPRQAVQSVETRKRDLVIRIADWTRVSPVTNDPAYDVEVYIGGVYDFNESGSFTLLEYGSKQAAKQAAITFVQNQTAKLL